MASVKLIESQARTIFQYTNTRINVLKCWTNIYFNTIVVCDVNIYIYIYIYIYTYMNIYIFTHHLSLLEEWLNKPRGNKLRHLFTP